CTAALSDQAPHQSFHDATPAVTSSKSVSATPFATKRGAQCAIADLTSASMKPPNLMLRSERSERLEAWPRAVQAPSPFETLAVKNDSKLLRARAKLDSSAA